jgi:Ala-tRNA(Pro) deacylase
VERTLAVLEETRRLKIGDLARAAGARSFSFAGEADLARRLGVRPGAVTPLALAHPGAVEVRAILDAAVLAAPLVNVHPLHNEATVALSPDDLLRFLAESGHDPLILDLGPPPPPEPSVGC